MLPIRRRSRFAAPPSAFERQLGPIASTMVASLAPTLPIVVDVPWLPPLGLIVFLAWRLRRGSIGPLWTALPLGLFDDLCSGQPLGTAMAGWTAILLVLDVVERRIAFRDHWQDWALVAAVVLGQILLGWSLVQFSGGDSSVLLMLPQWLFAVLLWPLTVRLCAMFDEASGASPEPGPAER